MSAPPALRRAFQDARSEFKEMSIGQLKDMEVLFTKYDTTQVCYFKKKIQTTIFIR